MRKKLFAANWKMNHGPKEAELFCIEFKPLVSPDAKKDWVIIPPFVSIPTVVSQTKSSPIKVGAQTCYFEDKGAFTGEISTGMLSEAGVAYVLVGHSERRQIFQETNSICAKKLKAVCERDLIPILCVGETREERKDNKTDQVIKSQLTESLSLWNKRSPLVIAYEPVWAIGTGDVATPDQAEKAHVVVRQVLAEICGGSGRAAEIQILYGGSVKPDNSRELIALPNIDGFLVGGASLQAKSFAKIGEIPL